MSLSLIPLGFLPLLAVRLTTISILLAHPTTQTLHVSFLNRLSSLSLLQFIPPAERGNSGTTNFPSKQASRTAQASLSVPQIARLVTVRVLSNLTAGSGVLIERQGQTYTVLTCDHVVADSQDNGYTVLTADGVTHPAQRLRSVHLGNADLALMQFTSKQSYRVAELGNSHNLSIGNQVYASGFPNWHWINSNAIEDTRNWGAKAFRLTMGTIGMLPEQSLAKGYQLGYTNEIEQGMSGGPVLDSNGRVIGINGRLKYPPQGIDAFVFDNGNVPSEQLFQQMEALSWAIPIATFQQESE